MKKIISLIVLLAVIVGGVFTVSVFVGEPQEMKVSKIKIINIGRDCTLTGNGKFRDTTLQTIVDVSAIKIGKYNLRANERKITLKIGSNEAENFSVHKIPKETPYVDGINDSGLHLITGGEFDGSQSDILTICYEGKCDTGAIERCK